MMKKKYIMPKVIVRYLNIKERILKVSGASYSKQREMFIEEDDVWQKSFEFPTEADYDL